MRNTDQTLMTTQVAARNISFFADDIMKDQHQKSYYKPPHDYLFAVLCWWVIVFFLEMES